MLSNFQLTGTGLGGIGTAVGKFRPRVFFFFELFTFLKEKNCTTLVTKVKSVEGDKKPHPFRKPQE